MSIVYSWFHQSPSSSYPILHNQNHISSVCPNHLNLSFLINKLAGSNSNNSLSSTFSSSATVNTFDFCNCLIFLDFFKLDVSRLGQVQNVAAGLTPFLSPNQQRVSDPNMDTEALLMSRKDPAENCTFDVFFLFFLNQTAVLEHWQQRMSIL